VEGVSAVSGMVGAFLAKTLIKRAYQAICIEEPTSASDPAATGTFPRGAIEQSPVG
jgi:hypothetical protein